MYLSVDSNLVASLRANDVISIFVYLLSFECCAILLWTVADRLFILSLKSVLIADMSSLKSLMCTTSCMNR